jgi:hypothetical protein
MPPAPAQVSPPVAGPQPPAAAGRAAPPSGTARVPTGTARVPTAPAGPGPGTPTPDTRPAGAGTVTGAGPITSGALPTPAATDRARAAARPVPPGAPANDLLAPPELPHRDSRRAEETTGTAARRRQREERLQESGGRRLPTATAAPQHSRKWLTVLIAVAVVAVLGVCGIGGYFVVNGDRAKPTGKTTTKAVPAKPRDISTRDVDPAPLTEQEVFPSQQIAVGTNTYQLLKTAAGNCGDAATDDLANMLNQVGCSQVVRGTLKSQDGQYLITAGIFNLKDEAGANHAYESIKPTLDAQKGRFTGLPAGDGTEAIVRAPTTLGWHPRGHFLAYCIVARTDGKPISADDSISKQIISDMVEGQLRDKVIGARAVASPSTAAKPGG